MTTCIVKTVSFVFFLFFLLSSKVSGRLRHKDAETIRAKREDRELGNRRFVLVAEEDKSLKIASSVLPVERAVDRQENQTPEERNLLVNSNNKQQRTLTDYELTGYTFDIATDLTFEGNYTGEPTVYSVQELVRLSEVYLGWQFAASIPSVYQDLRVLDAHTFAWDGSAGHLGYYFEATIVFRIVQDGMVPTGNETLQRLELAMNSDDFVSYFVWLVSPDSLFP